MPMLHWRKYGSRASGNPKTLAFIERVFTDLAASDEKSILNGAYMKRVYAEVCLTDLSVKPGRDEAPLYEVKTEEQS